MQKIEVIDLTDSSPPSCKPPEINEKPFFLSDQLPNDKLATFEPPAIEDRVMILHKVGKKKKNYPKHKIKRSKVRIVKHAESNYHQKLIKKDISLDVSAKAIGPDNPNSPPGPVTMKHHLFKNSTCVQI